jgi:CheY-like chemotaxis protein
LPDEPVILLVEDSENDVFFIREALTDRGLPNPIIVVDYLQGVGKFRDRARCPVPILVLLDLRLPGKSGYDALRWIRSQEPADDHRQCVGRRRQFLFGEALRFSKRGRNGQVAYPLLAKNGPGPDN